MNVPGGSLEALGLRLDRRLRPWLRAAQKLVDSKFEDVRSHAGNAVSQALVNTADGRPTAAKARNSPYLKAGQARLDELLTIIAGPSITSTDGFIQSARESFYEDSYPAWWKVAKAEYRVAMETPSSVAVSRCVGALWNGLTLRQSFAPQANGAKSSLAQAVVLAASGGLDDKTSRLILDTWTAKKKAAIFLSLRQALSDSDKLADRLAMRDVIRPEHLAKGSQIPGS